MCLDVNKNKTKYKLSKKLVKNLCSLRPTTTSALRSKGELLFPTDFPILNQPQRRIPWECLREKFSEKKTVQYIVTLI